jgi:Tol biopolymer transport system component
MSTLRFGSQPANMLDPNLFGFGTYMPSPEPELGDLSSSSIVLVDPQTGARLTLSGQFAVGPNDTDEALLASPLTGIAMHTGGGEMLFDWSAFQITLADFLFTDEVGLAEQLLGGSDSIFGGSGADMLFGDFPDWHDELVMPNPVATGEHLVMSADASTLAAVVVREAVPGDPTSVRRDVMVYDAESGSGRLMSSAGGAETVGTAALNPSLSRDGGLLVFRTNDPAFGSQPSPPSTYQVVARDTVTYAYQTVSTNAAGVAADANCEAPVVSADGSRVTFTSYARNLVDGLEQQAYFRRVYSKDLDTGEVKLVSTNAQGEAAAGDSFGSAVSLDGRYVAFASFAQNLVARTVPDTGPNLYVKDLDSGEVRFVASIGGAGYLPEADEIGLAISLDGAVVAFASSATDLVPGDTNNGPDVFVMVLDTGEYERASVDPYGQQALFGAASSSIALSGDGNYVAYYARDGGLAEPWTSGTGNVYVRDLAAMDTVRVSEAGANNMWTPVALSADGQTIAFTQTFGIPGSAQTDQLVVASLHGQGADRIEGGGGDDLYFAEPHDTVVERAGEGDDTIVVAWSEYVLPEHFENLFYGGHGFFTGTGNSSGNLVSGGPLGDLLRGEGGEDTMRGGAGGDEIDGGAGYDRALLQGASAGFSLAFAGDAVVLSDEGGTEGIDRLRNVERLQFSDKGVIVERGTPQQPYAGLPESVYHFFIVAFGAAPGVTYLDQLAEAWWYFEPLYHDQAMRTIVNIFTTKPQFTDVYPESLSNQDLAVELVNRIVKASATQAAKDEAIVDVRESLNQGWTRGDVIYTVFGNLAAKSFDDPTWGGTAKQFAHQIEVAKVYSEVLLQGTTHLQTLRDVLAPVTPDTDVGSEAKLVELVAQALIDGIGAV